VWAELAQGGHPWATAAVTTRDPKRPKLGRIVSGASSGDRTRRWLSDGHRLAKTATNCVANRWADGPDTPAGVRHRLLRVGGEAVSILVERLDDETIDLAIRGVRELNRRWAATPAGGTLHLEWPLPRSFPDG